MRKLLLFFCFPFCLFTNAQIKDFDIAWKAEVNYFFDNTEYARSNYAITQTMSGVNLTPQIGLSWDGTHYIFGGVNLLKRTGSNDFIDKVSFIGYYQYEKANSKLYAGIFPRRDLLRNYSDFLFQDSVTNFTPSMQGLFWQMENESSFFNLWLDWNGAQSPTVHETFFVGASAYKKLGVFFADFQSYMFHYANTSPGTPGFNVCDNILGQGNLGLELKDLSHKGSLLFSAGVLAGIERERSVQDYSPVGLVLRLKLEAFNLGLDSRFYWGDQRMKMYNKFGNSLYWGNPFLQSGSYLQSRLYWQIFNNQIVNARLASNFHLSEGQLMFEQMFTVTAKLDSK